MRRIYLIRHAHPDFPLGRHMCLGVTDTPLGPLGRMQVCLLGEALRDCCDAVFTSPLTRCRETAEAFDRKAAVIETLAEQNMGVWDGLDFDEIRQRWPELYARRATEHLLVPPGAETLREVRDRALPALARCLRESTGDIAVVTHASVIQALLAEACVVPLEESRSLRLPYVGFAILSCDRTLRMETIRRPAARLTPMLAEKLLRAAAPGEHVVAHCRAVADEALRIASALPLTVDRELLQCAALLHDVARREKDHARLGAAWLQELGFTAAASLVAQHHDLKSETIDEAAILYIADKCIQDDRRVSLEKRFAESEKKCLTEEARAAHATRLAQTINLRDAINRLCRRELVL